MVEQPVKPHDAAPRAGQCTATAKSTGERCRRQALKGAAVCIKHGASAPQVKAAAKRRLAAEAAANSVVTYGLPVDVDPVTALVAEVHRTAGHVAYLARKIADFESDLDLVQVDEGPGGAAKVAPSVWVELHQRERAHLVRVCQAAIGAGVQEAQVRLMERQAELVVTAMLGLAADLGCDDDPRLGELVRKHLTAVAALDAPAKVFDAADTGDTTCI